MRLHLSNTLRAGLVVLAAAAFMTAAHASNGSILGKWARGDGNARVRIEPCGDALCAVNTWIKDESGGERIGDRLVMRVSGNGESLSGTAYDPQRKLNYNLEIDVAGRSMNTRGCVLAGIVCKTINWTRVP